MDGWEMDGRLESRIAAARGSARQAGADRGSRTSAEDVGEAVERRVDAKAGGCGKATREDT